MSLRVTAVTLLVTFLCGYAWFRSWFVALCGAIVLMAFLEHPDMPRSILGIQGLNHWNILFLNVFLAWLTQRSKEGLEWDLPGPITVAFLLYLSVVVVSYLRLVFSPSPYLDEPASQMVGNFLINPLKFFIPCFLLYDGCRTRERVVWALGSVLLVYFLLAVQVIKYMGIHFQFGGEALEKRAARVIERDVGFHRVDMSMMLAGASWAVVAFSQMFEKKWVRLLLWGAAGVIVMGQAMTAGRAGYVSWACVGLFLCVVKWRRLLPLVPIGVIAVMTFVPGVRDRVFHGFGEKKGPVQVEADQSELTAGRSDIWPHVVDKIMEAPLIGYGRQGMRTTGLTDFATVALGDTFGHPHNAYLEMLLDNGLIGFLCVMPLYLLAMRKGLGLFRDREDRLFEVVGGVALSLLLALLIAGLGAQTLYPREGVIGMWAVIGIALRVWVQREDFFRSEATAGSGEEWDNKHLAGAEFYRPTEKPGAISRGM